MYSISTQLDNTFEMMNLEKPQGVAKHVKSILVELKPGMPIIAALCTEGIKDRHWKKIYKKLNIDEASQVLDPEQYDGKTQYKDDINLDEIIYRIKEKNSSKDAFKETTNELDMIADTASREFKNENILKGMHSEWEPAEFSCKEYKGTYILDGEAIEIIQTLLDDHIVKTQSMKGSPYAKEFLPQIIEWEADLNRTQENLEVWLQVQAVWLYLEPVFSSEDIMNQMPQEGRKFKEVDQGWRELMHKVNENPSSLDVIKIEGLGEILKQAHAKLEEVQKGLNDYLSQKRLLFPRFFFLSNDELLEILSETKEPLRVQPHLKKCFEGIAKLEFDDEKKILGMYSSEDEHVPFTKIIDPIAARGQVEVWLLEVEEQMLMSIKDIIEKSLKDYVKKERSKWVLGWQGQAVLAGSMRFWTYKCETAMKKNGVQGLVVLNNELDQ